MGHDDKDNASPIEKADDASTFELSITQLSLPDSFDESLCLDHYRDLKVPKSKTVAMSIVCDDMDAADPFIDPSPEAKVRKLTTANLDLKEKCRHYDKLRKSSADYEKTIEGLRSKLSQQSSLYDVISNREKELQHQLLQYKQKIQLINMDLDHARDEATIILQRAEKAEKECETNASALRSVQHKFDVAISRHAAEQEVLKSEISRLREESNKEILTSQTHRNEAFAREATLLRDARDHAIEQAKTLQQDLNELRYEKEAKEADYLDVNKELERQINDVRSDLRVKACELNTLRACHDRAVTELNQLKEQHTETETTLTRLQHDHAHLERQAIVERSKSEEIIRQKTELLEIYQHEDILIEVDDKCVTTSDVAQTLSGRKSLLKNSIALASKCRKLQSMLKQTGEDLAIEREKNQFLMKKNQDNQRLCHELAAQTKKHASAGMMSSIIKARDKEVFELSSKMNTLQLELSRTRQERDTERDKLTDILSRRETVIEMKALVESMRGFIECRRCKTMQSECVDDDDDDDILDHVVHRGTSAIR